MINLKVTRNKYKKKKKRKKEQGLKMARQRGNYVLNVVCIYMKRVHEVTQLKKNECQHTAKQPIFTDRSFPPLY